jgi:hypothetical protein
MRSKDGVQFDYPSFLDAVTGCFAGFWLRYFGQAQRAFDTHFGSLFVCIEHGQHIQRP